VKAVGYVVRAAGSGRIIVKLFVEVREGMTLYDRRGRKIGVVREVFGSVRSPYASLEARTDRVSGLIGETAYAEVSEAEGRRHMQDMR
jgi:rRNA processing protein Gar1